MDYSIQLYSVRDAVQENMDETLKKIAEIGYKYVEPAGFFGHSADEVRAMLDKYGLKVSGTHTGWKALRDDYEGTVAYHKTIGTDMIIIPNVDASTREKLDEFIDFINEVQPRLKKDGMRLAFHNHSREFVLTSYGECIHKELAERTNIEFEIDTYWAFNAGVDPIAILERLKDRVHFIHVKDGMKGTGKGKPLGHGEAPVADVYAKAVELGLQMVVESETQDPDGITEAQICFDYLKSLEK